MAIIHETFLGNGLTVRFHDLTQRYFGDYFRVRLEVVCEVQISRDNCPDDLTYNEARTLLGDNAFHRQTLEQMAVQSEEVERTLAGLVEKFNTHSSRYLASFSFPSKMVLAEIDKAKRKMRRTYTP